MAARNAPSPCSPKLFTIRANKWCHSLQRANKTLGLWEACSFIHQREPLSALVPVLSLGGYCETGPAACGSHRVQLDWKTGDVLARFDGNWSTSELNLRTKHVKKWLEVPGELECTFKVCALCFFNRSVQFCLLTVALPLLGGGRRG